MSTKAKDQIGRTGALNYLIERKAAAKDTGLVTLKEMNGMKEIKTENFQKLQVKSRTLQRPKTSVLHNRGQTIQRSNFSTRSYKYKQRDDNSRATSAATSDDGMNSVRIPKKAILETKFIRFGEGNSYYTASQTAPTVVVKYSTHFQGKIAANGRNRNYHNYRYISNRARGSPQQSDSSRIMGQFSPELAHRLSRDGSSIFDFETFSKTNSKQYSVDQMQQHNSTRSSVHKQARENGIFSSLFQTWDLCNWAILLIFYHKTGWCFKYCWCSVS
uniref:Uncharacterized protein n=1 Tax=Magallana gigas TaxID=29159 RepID=A0A8W8IHI5_MAGGI